MCIHVNNFKIYVVCVCTQYTVYTLHTHTVYYVNKNFYFGCDSSFDSTNIYIYICIYQERFLREGKGGSVSS